MSARSDLAPSPSVNWSTAVSRSPRPSCLPPPLIARQLASARLPSASVRPCPSPLVNWSTAELLPAPTSPACPRSALVNWRAPPRPPGHLAVALRMSARPTGEDPTALRAAGTDAGSPPGHLAGALLPLHRALGTPANWPGSPTRARRTTKVDQPTGGLPSPWSAPGGDRPRAPTPHGPPSKRPALPSP